MSRAIAIMLSGGGLSLLIALAFLARHQTGELGVFAILGASCLSVALAAGAEHAELNMRVFGYDTFMDLSMDIARRISALSEVELQGVPGLHN
jgi:hypothetical protein